MPQSLGLLVVSHGELAGELVKATRRIVGDLEALEAISIGWNDAVDASGRRIEEAVRRLDRGHGVLLLTDMFGGTPTNLALSLLQEGKVEIVTGVNLPMLIKATTLGEESDLGQAAALVADQGMGAIQVASHFLKEHGAEP